MTESETTNSQLTVVPCLYAAKTDVGKRRSDNQDTHGVARSLRSNLFLLADGMGGAHGGATASQIAVEVIAKCSGLGKPDYSIDKLKKAVEYANEQVYKASEAHSFLSGMGTTLVALTLYSDKAFIVSVGDSRAYLLRGGSFKALTKDHTVAQELVDAGNLNPADAVTNPISHMLTRCLGTTESVDLDVIEVEGGAKQDDHYLLCSDGLFNHVSDEEIRSAISDNKLLNVPKILVDLANSRGGSDNITVQLVKVDYEKGHDNEEIPEGEYIFNTTSKQEFAADDGEIALSQIADLEDVIGPTQKVEEQVGSALDSIMFGETPTSEDIQKHQEKVQGNSKKRPEEPVSEEDDDDGELVPVSLEEDEQEKNFQYESEEGFGSSFNPPSTGGMGFIAVIGLSVVIFLALPYVIDQSEEEKEEQEFSEDVYEDAVESYSDEPVRSEPVSTESASSAPVRKAAPQNVVSRQAGNDVDPEALKKATEQEEWEKYVRENRAKAEESVKNYETELEVAKESEETLSSEIIEEQWSNLAKLGVEQESLSQKFDTLTQRVTFLKEQQAYVQEGRVVLAAKNLASEDPKIAEMLFEVEKASAEYDEEQLKLGEGNTSPELSELQKVRDAKLSVLNTYLTTYTERRIAGDLQEVTSTLSKRDEMKETSSKILNKTYLHYMNQYSLPIEVEEDVEELEAKKQRKLAEVERLSTLSPN